MSYLRDFRWRYGVDKSYKGRAAWDPTGVGESFLDWVNRNRFTLEIVSALRSRVSQELSEAVNQATTSLEQGMVQQAAVGLHRTGQLMINYLLESCGVRGSSFGRLGTLFERAMVENGQAGIARQVMEVMLLAHISQISRVGAS